MKDEEIIKKAEIAIKGIGLTIDNEFSKSVSRVFDKLIVQEMPELENEYAVHFSKKGVNGGKIGYTVTVDKKTNKLLTIITRSNIYVIPKELQ